jgi:hypothetical protein
MHLLLDLKNYKKKNIFFEERRKNNVVSECYYIGLQYSNDMYNLTNLMFQLNMKGKIKINANDDVLSITYDESTHQLNSLMFRRLMYIEEQILLHYKKYHHKNVQLNLHNLFSKRYIRICTDTSKSQLNDVLNNKIVDQLNLAFRISGLWENSNGTVGIIYKFINIDPVLNISDIYDNPSRHLNYHNVDDMHNMHNIYPSVRSSNSFLT